MNTEQFISGQVAKAVSEVYGRSLTEGNVQLQKTRKEFEGDITLVTFALVKITRRSPEQTAEDIGGWLVKNVPGIASYNVVKGFLNISLSTEYWLKELQEATTNGSFGSKPANLGKSVMVEYSSPNTNKPLHLGHIRNILLGYSVAEMLKVDGSRVQKVNLVNDRGIHICKSMIAWQKFGNGETPQSSGKKGDHLVGDYYVKFDQEYKKQIKELMGKGVREEEAKKQAPIMLEAQEMLRKWEQGDEEVVALWRTMNGWVYEGFDKTYNELGIDFDKTYYESNTYLLGKEIVAEGLEKGVFFTKEDGSVWIDLTEDGLDQKLVQRADGTSVYITQDMGTAVQRFTEDELDAHIYVVGNEQNYHFQVLKLILKKLGYEWADSIEHLSYGMVELPEGKMKSREGTVVDADELLDEMFTTAREMSKELGKLDGLSEEEANGISKMIGLGALKYYMLKVDPKKGMLFNPRESIDFNGNTGPFIQYTHARIKSVLRKAQEQNVQAAVATGVEAAQKELDLVKSLMEYPTITEQAAATLSPALIANYIYELAKEFNQFYHDFSILREEKLAIKQFRLALSAQVAEVIRRGMKLLGIDVPERM
jgi:arginyl-tRNA synthetase